MADRLGQQYGNYRLVSLLGEGGFAEVYLGQHLRLDLQAAIKVLHTHLTGKEAEHFQQEAQTIAKLVHPAIVRILDYDVQEGVPFLVMDYAPHGSLRQRYPRGEVVPLPQIVSYVKQVAEALQYAHEHKFIHRDVKPENMLLGRREEVLLSDFGIATIAQSTGSLSAQETSGTLAYMAPEQIQGHPRPASDQYALGCMVYEWLCGTRPFEGSATEVMVQQLSIPPQSLRERDPTITLALEQVVLRALAKDPKARFSTVQDFATALEQASQRAISPAAQLASEQPALSPAAATGYDTVAVAPDHPVLPAESTPSSPLWNVPFARNPFFTGREPLIERLHEQLCRSHSAALNQSYALSGLGGIGKTQTAIEYAYRYRAEYSGVFWVRAASRETLVADYVAIARLLSLPGQDAQDQLLIVAATKRWLEQHKGWLLIMDNADELSTVKDLLPAGGQGHLLLTTRSQATGKIARSLSVEKMELVEGMQLLLRRSKLLGPEEPLDNISAAVRAAAQQLVTELDGLPLALDQVGAYIEETSCSLSEYLALYRQRRLALLKRPSRVSVDYPHTVASTWALSFGQVEQESPAAADLLRLCAFLAPDAIPEEIVTEGAAELGSMLEAVVADPLLLNEAIQVLRRYSLVKRDPEVRLLNLHRLVQVVLKDGLDQATQRQWAERVVRAVNAAFPAVSFATWSRCERCLPHAQACAALIDEHHFTFPEAARLLDQLANIYLFTGYLDDAIKVGLASCALLRDLGDVVKQAETYLDVAFFCHWQGREREAVNYIQRALECLKSRSEEASTVRASSEEEGTLDSRVLALQAKAYAQWGMAATIMGEIPEALKKLHQADLLHQQIGGSDPFISIVSLWSLSWCACVTETPRHMLAYALQATEVCRTANKPEWESMMHYSAAWAYMLLGQLTEGEQNAREALRKAQQYSVVGAEGWANLVLAFLAIQAGRWEEAKQTGDDAYTIATTLRDADLQARILWSRSVCAGWQGDWEHAIAEVLEALKVARQEGEDAMTSIIYPHLLIQAAKAYFHAGYLDQAQQYLDQGMQLAQRRCYRQLPAIGLRLQGRIWQAQGKFAEAQPCFEQSLSELLAIDDLVEYARTQEAYGLFYLASKQSPGLPDYDDDFERGQSLIKSAQATFQRLGVNG